MTTPQVQGMTPPQVDEMIPTQVQERIPTQMEELTSPQLEGMPTPQMDEATFQILENWLIAHKLAAGFVTLLLVVVATFYGEGAEIICCYVLPDMSYRFLFLPPITESNYIQFSPIMFVSNSWQHDGNNTAL